MPSVTRFCAWDVKTRAQYAYVSFSETDIFSGTGVFRRGSASFGETRLRMLRRVEDAIEPCPVLGKLVLRLIDQFLRARVAQ